VGETSPMRRRITTLSMTAVVTAVLVFAIPLAVAARLLLVSTEFGELQRAAADDGGTCRRHQPGRR